MKNRRFVKTFEQYIFEATESENAISAADSLTKSISDKGFMSVKKAGAFSKEEIQKLHTVLKNLGYNVAGDAESGKYGLATKKAVADFQAAAKAADIQDPDGYTLNSDGAFGEKSLNVAKMILDDASLKKELDANKTVTKPDDTFKLDDDKAEDPYNYIIQNIIGVRSEDKMKTAGGWYVQGGEFAGIAFFPKNKAGLYRYFNTKTYAKGSYSLKDREILLNPDEKPADIQKDDTEQPTTTAAPIAGDFDMFDYNGKKIKFSQLKAATNKWYENKWYQTGGNIVTMIEKNDDKQFIVEFNKLIKDKLGITLVDYMKKSYTSLTGSHGLFSTYNEAFKIILKHTKDPVEDAKILAFIIQGLGADDSLFDIYVNARENEPDAYKEKVKKAYSDQNGGEDLGDALNDESDLNGDPGKIAKIVPNFV